MSGLLGGITSPAPACCSCSGRAPAGLALRPVAGRRAAPRPAAACASRRAPRVTRGPRRAAAYDEEGEEAEKWYEEPPEVPYVPQWPNPQYMEEVAEAFEGTYGKDVADPEEARCLVAQGFTLLDIRSQVQVDMTGKPRGAVHVPYWLSKKQYDAEQGKTVILVTENPDFIKEVARRFPDREAARLLVADADGRPDSGAQEALEMLDDAGFGRLVGVVGGMRRFLRVFDMKLARRPSRGAFVEDPWSEGSSQGLFAGES